MLERGLLQSNFDLGEQLDDVARIVRKYKDLPTFFADACLVAMRKDDLMHGCSPWTKTSRSTGSETGE